MARSFSRQEIAQNRQDWDALVPYHVRSRYYGVDEFLRGRSTLSPVERREIGPVRGKRLLHLQCHFGLDTLSWARLGARVTGVDFSPQAIQTARELAQRSHLKAEFVLSDVHRLPRRFNSQFDIVFASHGVLAWTSRLSQWMRGAARSLRPGGMFYLLEAHPVLSLFEEGSSPPRLARKRSYLSHREPSATGPGSYADSRAPVRFPRHQWHWDLEDVVNAVAGAGLTVESLREHTAMSSPWFFPQLRRAPDGMWKLPANGPQIPLMFSIRARKCA